MLGNDLTEFFSFCSKVTFQGSWVLVFLDNRI